MISYTGGLVREYHHIRNAEEDSESFEPTMVIIHNLKPGKSFMIPMASIWKYVEPIDNKDAYPSDIEEFKALTAKILREREIGKLMPGLEGQKVRQEAAKQLAACAFATALWHQEKILPTVGWNLFILMDMFDIEPCPPAAAQLLLWIQDGLDDLKNMPPSPYPENELACGEIQVFEGDNKIVDTTLTVKEADLTIEEGT